MIGRLLDPEEREPGSLVVRQGGPKGRRVQADAFGRFRLKLPATARTVNLAIERDGEVIAEHRIDATGIDGELQLELPAKSRAQRDLTAITLDQMRGQRLVERALPGLRERALLLGVEEGRVAAVERLIDELEELSLLAAPALSGGLEALELLRASLAEETPFDFSQDLGRFKPFPEEFGIDPCQVLPSSPWHLVQAGLMLDAGEGLLWAGRAVSAMLRRSEPAARVSRALSGIEAGEVGEAVLVEALEFAGRVASDDPSRAPVWDSLRTGPEDGVWGGPPIGGRLGRPELRPFPRGGFDPFPPGPDGSDVPSRPGIATLLNPCNLEWLECAHTFVTARPAANPNPPTVGRIEPDDILAGAPTQITLYPPSGETFPVDQHSSWSVTLGSTALTVSSWAPDKIVLDVPALTPSCLKLVWLVDQLDAATFLNEQTAACSRFFGGRRPELMPVLPFAIGQVSVVGDPKVESFTADGAQTSLNAEGCTSVSLGWSIDPMTCSGTSSLLSVEVKDDRGTVLYQGPARSGSRAVTEQADRTYTLTATATLNGAVAGRAVAKLQVDRYQRVTTLEKTAPVGPVKTGATVTLRASLSCPADDDVNVVVSSDHPDRCPGVTIRVSAGQSSATGQVTAGQKCGSVALSASIPNVAQSPATTRLLVHNPKVDALVGANVDRCDGGQATVRVGCAATVSAMILSGSQGTVTGSTPQLTPSVPTDPAAGTIQAVSNFPALPAGAYTLQIVADGIVLNAGTVNVVIGPPSVSLTATPTAVQVCAATTVTLTANARKASEVSITTDDGTVLVGPVMASDLCAGVRASTTVTVGDTSTFKAIAKRQGAPNASDESKVEGITLVATASQVAVYNGNAPNDPTLFVYVDSVPPGAFGSTISRVGAIAPRSQVTYTPTRCEVFELFAGTVDSQGIITNNLWTWRSGRILGHPIGATPLFSAFGT